MRPCIIGSSVAAVLTLLAATTAIGIPGACCLPDTTCALYTLDACAAAGGFYWGDGTPCAPDPCRPGLGVCCSHYGECSITTFADCVVQDGVCTWMEGMDSCDPNPCPACCPVACCMHDGSCRLVWCGEDCSAIGGTWIPGETFCHPNPCAVSDVPDDGSGGRARVVSWGTVRSIYR